MKFMFEVRIKPGFTVEEYAAAWVRASELIQQGAGARGTYLHRKIGAPDVLLAIAHWDSKADRDAQQERAEQAVRDALGPNGRYCEVTVLGEYEDPEWSAEPPSGGAAGRS